MTAQEVIKSFTKQLANHGYASSDSVGTYMLDSAVRASSRYSSIQEAIDAFKADQVKAEMEAVEEVLGSDYAGKTMYDLPDSILDADAKDYDPDNKSNAYYDPNNDSRSTVENLIKERMSDIFLQKYCGIILNEKFFFDSSGTVKSWSKSTDNDDTGAITGSDAGTSTTKTKSSVVPEEFINTYTASTAAAQNIITNDRNWVVQATDSNDTITSNAADSISAGAGDDSIIANGSGATITSGDGSDFITISKGVTDITLSDLNEYDTLTIRGTFDVGSAQIEESLLVITDRTGTRKIKLGDFENAKNAKVNSTTIANWLANAGISLDNLTTKNYSDGKVVSSSNVNNSSAVTVDLDTVDTSKIGNVTVDGAVVGSLSSTFPNASTFTRNGLTIHLLGVASDTSGSTSKITAKTLDELTDAQKTIVAGLFKWWVGNGLTLSEESFGISFNSPTATIKDMGLFFYDGQGVNTTLAAAPYWPRSADGAITQLMLKINMHYYNNIKADDLDGTTTIVKNLLDRTLAHELTHSNMETNINFFNKLPQFIVEGAAELTHGIDDERGNRIFNIAANTSSIATVLNVNNTSTGNANYYAGGYMFLRYFAKTVAAQTLPAFGEITATVNPNSSGDYYISGNKTSETASTTAQDIKLGTVSNGVYTVEDTGVHQVIKNTNNFKIAGLTVNDKLIGSSAADTIQTAQGSYITSGDGTDSIKIYGQFATIDAGADNDTVIAQDGSHHFISLAAGNDFVEFKPGNIYSNTIAGGEGDDKILLTVSYDASIDMGAGDDSIYFGGNNNTINAGEGNDTLQFRYSNDSKNFIELGAGDDKATIYGASNTLDGGEGDDFIYTYNNATNTFFRYKSGDGSDTISGFNSTSTLIIGGGLGTYSTVESDSDIIVTVGDGSIILEDAADLENVNIVGDEIIDDGKPIWKRDGNKVSYGFKNSDENLLELDGIELDSNLTLEDDTVKLSADNFSDDGVTVVSNAGGYGFELADGDYLDGTFNGSESKDFITNNGSDLSIIGRGSRDSIINNGSTVTIEGGAGRDRIVNMGANVEISGGKGNDIISLSGGEQDGNTLVYSSGDGRDVIYNFTGNDKIKIADNSTVEADVVGDDIEFKVGNGSITIRDGAKDEVEVTFINSSGTEIDSLSGNKYTADGVINSEGEILLASNFKGTYTATAVTKVNGSQTKKGVAMIDGGTKEISFVGGKGKDTLTSGENNFDMTGGKGNDIFVYNGGQGIITDYSEKGSNGKDKISLGDSLSVASYETSDDNVILNFGGDNYLTIEGGVNKAISFGTRNSTVNVYTEEGLFDGKEKSVKLASSVEKFNAAKMNKLISIDGSAADDEISITGNSKKNYIVAGENGSTLDGGKGKDTLFGGDGQDVFLYNAGDGKDIIENFGDGDRINLNGATIKDAMIKNNNGVIKIGSGSLTVKDNSIFILEDEQNQTIFADGAFYTENIAKVYGSFKGTIDLSESEFVTTDGSVYTTTADASLAKKSITINGGTLADSIVGGKGKDILYGNAGNDTLWGNKGNDTLYGRDGDDTFIFNAGNGNDKIMDYEQGDMLQIFDKSGSEGSFTSTFADGTLKLSIKGGGRIILSGLDSTTSVNINYETKTVSDWIK